jgi:hypothetical protein
VFPATSLSLTKLGFALASMSKVLFDTHFALLLHSAGQTAHFFEALYSMLLDHVGEPSI